MKMVKNKKKAESITKSKSLVSIKKKKPATEKLKQKKIQKLQLNGNGDFKSSNKKLKNKKTTKKEATVPKDIGEKVEKTKTKTKPKPKDKDVKKSNFDGLKDIDPEFYEFLRKNDKKLLEFNILDSDDDIDDDLSDDGKTSKQKTKKLSSKTVEDEEVDSEEEKFHKPNENLEVASDESDLEDDDDDDEPKMEGDGTQKVTLNLLRRWQTELEKPNVSIAVVRKVIQAFNSALVSITPDAESMPISYKVDGSAAFNGIIQLCILHLQPAILRILGLTNQSKTPLHKTKKWKRVRSCLRHYLTDLVRLVQQVSSANILCVLLKHLHQMAGMIGSFTTLGKTILKRLIVLWATEDETVRVLAFLCILKITRNQQISMLHHVLKAMYLSYVRNSKFVSPNTLPSINFMRRSLVEMFALDMNVSYQHSFLYIRQLAIHLRNAVILKKKDSIQAVYNWQFVNSLRLWADLLGATSVAHNKPQLHPLIYPLVTITIGVIRLVPTAQYFPLRFHCIQTLISLSKTTNTFIPILPFILEVLQSNTFNKKHTAVSMRPLQFTCILRLNKTQLSENGFRDEVIEQVCSLTLEYLAHESSSLAFSDLVVPSVLALKAYLKDCRNANYSRKLKTLLDKIQENAKFIDLERRKFTFALKDLGQVKAWETRVSNKGTPLAIYYESWVKTHETKKRRQAAHSDSINDDYGIPSVSRKNTIKNNLERNENGDIELFPSDSEDESTTKLPKKQADKVDKIKKKQKKVKDIKKNEKLNAAIEAEKGDESNADDEIDIVKDLDIDDW